MRLSQPSRAGPASAIRLGKPASRERGPTRWTRPALGDERLDRRSGAFRYLVRIHRLDRGVEHLQRRGAGVFFPFQQLDDPSERGDALAGIDAVRLSLNLARRVRGHILEMQMMQLAVAEQ